MIVLIRDRMILYIILTSGIFTTKNLYCYDSAPGAALTRNRLIQN